MKSAFSVLLLCFLLSSCGEEKTVEAEKTVEVKKVVEAEKVIEAEKTIPERPKASDIDGRAQYELAKKYESGEGVPQDFAEAAKWRRKAAEQGNADAKEWLKKNAKDKSE